MTSFRSLDEKSLETLFRSHFIPLCQFAAGYVKNSDIAREIVQDTFVTLWEKRASIDLSKPVKSYLSTTVKNKCLNYLRDHKKFSASLLSIENHPDYNQSELPDPFIEAEIRDKVTRAIDELPEKCREVFMLNRFENLKYQQVADRLQISVKTVETHMSKALQHLRLRLSEYLPLLVTISIIHQFVILISG